MTLCGAAAISRRRRKLPRQKPHAPHDHKITGYPGLARGVLICRAGAQPLTLCRLHGGRPKPSQASTSRIPAPSLPPRPQRRIKKKTVNALRQHPLKYTQKPHCAWQKTGSFRDNPGRSLFFAIYLRQLWLIAQSALRFL